jgi:cytochrome c oxidase subunit II
MHNLLLIPLLLGLGMLGDLQAADSPRIIEIQAKKFKYTPNEIHLKLGDPVIMRLTSLDRKHGFKVPELELDTTVKPGETSDVKITPQKKGRFPFHCSVFCGSGHEETIGVILVE